MSKVNYVLAFALRAAPHLHFLIFIVEVEEFN